MSWEMVIPIYALLAILTVLVLGLYFLRSGDREDMNEVERRVMARLNELSIKSPLEGGPKFDYHFQKPPQQVIDPPPLPRQPPPEPPKIDQDTARP